MVNERIALDRYFDLKYLEIKVLEVKVTSPDPKGDDTMSATILIRHQVLDYGAWRTVYDSVEPLRQQFGCTAAEVHTDPTDKNDVFVIHRFPTIEQAQGFAGSDDLKAAMGTAGVAGPPRIEIVRGA